MKHLFTAALLFFAVSLAAQATLERQVLASQGASEQTERFRLDWTLGEPAVATLTTPSGLWTEGFQQPVLRVEAVLPMTTTPTTVYDIRVAPNPTDSRLSVQFPGNLEGELILELLDLNGKSLQRRSLPAPSDQEIDLGAWPDGMYLLRFSSRQGQLIQTFRILKAR